MTERLTTTRSQKIKGFIKGTVVFLLVTMSLFHVFFEASPPEVNALRKEYNEVIAKRNSLQKSYLEQLKAKTITVDEYYSLVSSLLKESKSNIKRINQEKVNVSHAFSFRGRSSFHFWIFVFGLVSALLFFSCKSLFDDLSKGSNYKFQFVSLAGIAISCFWMIHLLFFTQKDFNKNSYITLIVLSAVLCSIFIYFLIKYYTYKDQIIYSLLGFISRVKKRHFYQMAFRSEYAERTGAPYSSKKSNAEIMRDFDNDLNTTLKEI